MLVELADDGIPGDHRQRRRYGEEQPCAETVRQAHRRGDVPACVQQEQCPGRNKPRQQVIQCIMERLRTADAAFERPHGYIEIPQHEKKHESPEDNCRAFYTAVISSHLF